MNLRDFPIEDVDAWTANPPHRWVYNRLSVSEVCGVPCGPAGVEPGEYPVIWKPVINLWGMGRGAEIAEGPTPHRSGFMWQKLLTGRHVSTDVMVTNGGVIWHAQALGIAQTPRSFSAWFLGVDFYDEWDAVAHFVGAHLAGYSGPVNVETIGGQIIEVHLRLTQDWLSAGAYDTYPAPAPRMVGVPVFQPCGDAPDWVTKLKDDGDPRHAFLATRCL